MHLIITTKTMLRLLQVIIICLPATFFMHMIITTKTMLPLMQVIIPYLPVFTHAYDYHLSATLLLWLQPLESFFLVQRGLLWCCGGQNFICKHTIFKQIRLYGDARKAIEILLQHPKAILNKPQIQNRFRNFIEYRFFINKPKSPWQLR